MKDLLLEENTNNLDIVNFDLALTSGNAQFIQQKLFIKLKTVLGEWYLNTTVGLPWFTEIAKKNPDIDLIEDLIRAEILAESLVEEITEFTILYDNSVRELSVSFIVKLVDGSTAEVEI